MKILNKIFDIVFIVFLVLCLVVAIIPFLFRVKLYVIGSESMRPNMNVGDLVLVKKIDKDKLKKNDIIAYNRDNIVIIHRIKDKDKEGLITKGDNNLYEDINKVYYNQVIGKSIIRIPIIGHVYSFISKFSLLICSSILIFGVILYYYNIKAKRGDTK